MEYSWKIARLGLSDEVNSDGVTLENSVVLVQWKKIATDENGVTASYVSKTKFSVTDIAESDFIPLHSITKDMVVGWLEATIHPHQMDFINRTLARKIEANKVRYQTPVWN